LTKNNLFTSSFCLKQQSLPLQFSKKKTRSTEQCEKGKEELASEQKQSVPVAELLVEADDGVLLLLAEVAALDVRAQVVDPPEPAALPTPQQPCTIGTPR
jgi:hypothetical protein